MFLRLTKRNHRITKLENNSLFTRRLSPFDGKQSEERKLARVSIVKCPVKKCSVCQHRRLTLACWVLKRCKTDRNQHQTSENNKCNVSHSSCTINDSNLEWSVLFDASMRSSKHACMCSTMYSRSPYPSHCHSNDHIGDPRGLSINSDARIQM